MASVAYSGRSKSIQNTPAMAAGDISRKPSSYITLTRSKSHTKSFSSHSDKPSPLFFDTFVPYVCTEWECPYFVKVFKKKQDVYIPMTTNTPRKVTKTKSKQVKLHEDTPEKEKESKHVMPPENLEPIYDDTTFSIIVYYNEFDRLVEIATVGCPYEIHRTVLKAINLCLPFQKHLTKISFRKGGVSDVVLYNIALGLPTCNVTEICLDDSYVKQGNYYVLLDEATPLRHLSLCRCAINDVMVKAISLRLVMGAPASESLQILDLTSNKITDLGAQALADMLRTNRRLLHLGLAGNKITDVGAASILEVMSQFRLTDDEVKQMKIRRWNFFKYKNGVYQQCLKEIIAKRQKTPPMLPPTRTSISSGSSRSSKAKVPVRRKSMLDVYEMAQMNADKIAGETFKDLFDDEHIIHKNGNLHALGNFKFCSLNLAYNDLDIFTLTKVVEVLRYQNLLSVAPDHDNGLMKIVLDGNYMPNSCEELDDIRMYLKSKLVIGNWSGLSTAQSKRRQSRKFSLVP